MIKRRRTKRMTIRCDPIEHDGVVRLADFLGESQSATIRRMIRAVTQNLDLLGSLDTGRLEQGYHGEGEKGVEEQQAETGNATRLMTALLTAYREAGSSQQPSSTESLARQTGKESNIGEEGY